MEGFAIIALIVTVIFTLIMIIQVISAVRSGKSKNSEAIYLDDTTPKNDPLYISEFEEDYEESEEDEEDEEREETPPKKKFCTSCGGELSENQKFCPNCGTKNVLYSETEKENASSNVVVSIQQTNNSNSGKTVVRCPNCGSTNIHFITSQGGQRIDKGGACCGFLACGPLGLLCGVKDEDTKTIRKCMNCNHEF